jgi:adenylate cyclase
MSLEIEKKFLVDKSLFLSWLESQSCTPAFGIVQGYPIVNDNLEVRIRRKIKIGVSEQSPSYTITLKSSNKTLTRSEYELAVSGKAAEQLLESCEKKISKTRHILEKGVSVDIFHDEHDGLCLLEVEFDSEEDANSYQVFYPFVVKEVTGQKEYYNAELVKKVKV